MQPATHPGTGLPRRTVYSNLETSSQARSVVPLAACVHHRRRGPVSGSVEEVLHLAFQGKYSNRPSERNLPDAFPSSSLNVLKYENKTLLRFPPPLALDYHRLIDEGAPERIAARIMEAPVPPKPVEPFAASVLQPRSGPELRVCTGVFQFCTFGKYSCINSPASSDVDPILRVPLTRHRIDVLGASLADPVKRVQSPLVIYYQNVGGMNSTLTDYKLACSDACYDIYAFSETWLNDHTHSKQLFDCTYNVYRQDRSSSNSTKRSGGGVLLAIRSCFNSCQLVHPDNFAVEQIWVKISLQHTSIFFCVVYIPPDRVNDAVLIEKHVNYLDWIVAQMSARDSIVIFGDFNLRDIVWQKKADGSHYIVASCSSINLTSGNLLDAYSTANMLQMNGITNQNGRTLDLCFVTQDISTVSDVIQAPTSLVKVCRHHPPLQLSLQVNVPPTFDNGSANSVYFDFEKGDYEAMNSFLTTVNWEDELRNCDTNIATAVVTNILLYAIDQFVPKKMRREQVRPVWATSKLKHFKKIKRKALRRYNRVRTFRSKLAFLKASKKYKRLNNHLFYAYQRRLQQRFKSNPRRFWRYVNDQRKETGWPSTMRYNNKEASSIEDIAILFRVQFSSVFSCDSICHEDITNAINYVPTLPAIGNIHDITCDTIISAAKRLKRSSTTGPDGIPSVVLKNCISAIAPPLALLYNLSLQSGVFPVCWKNSFIFPVHKKGCKRTVSNYRGISALCALSKLFEIIVLDFLSQKFLHYISPDQHGFVPKRSTTTNLVTFTSFITRQMEKGLQVDAIYTDLSSAFDKVNHEIALAKFDRIGIDNNLLLWLRSYLMGRQAAVKLGDYISTAFPVTSGVPQGSHLGPFLFLLYMNDVNFALQCMKKSYADDLKLYHVISKPQDTLFLQQQLVQFAEWCRRNRMVVNASKCSTISFGRKLSLILYDYVLHNTTLKRETTVKDLGVFLDSKLTFKDHVSYIVSKASSQLGFIFRFSKTFKDVYCLKALYCALVRSTLEYSVLVWSPFYQNEIARIEAIQRKFIRFALRHLPWSDPNNLPNYASRCKLIDLDQLSVRREVAKACFVSDLLCSNIDCPELLSQLNINTRRRVLRSHAFLTIEPSRTNYGMNEPVRNMCRVFETCYDVFDFNLSRNVIRKFFIRLLST